MKIAYLSTAQVPSNRANSIQVMKVCQALVQNGEEVTLYVPGDQPADNQDFSSYYGLSVQFPLVYLKSRRSLKRFDFTLAGIRQARKNRSDLVYTRMIWAAFLARLRGFAVVLEMHDLPQGHLAPLIYRLFLKLRRPKLIVYITSALKQHTDEALAVKAREREFLIAPDGVDLERYENLPRSAEARSMLGLEEKVTAAYSGGFYAGRGLEIMQELALSFPQVQFLWIGGNSQQVSEWQARLGAAKVDNVILTGFVENAKLPLYQAAADVLLMPYSLAFGGSGGGDISAVSSPMKLFEYMAAGRCILASDLPVLREVLHHASAAFYQPEDFSDLCAQFAGLISDTQKREALAAAAKEDVKAYSWRRRMTGIMRAIRNLTGKQEPKLDYDNL